MQKRAGLVAAFLLFFSAFAFAQGNGTIKGFVYDKKTGEALISANVMVVDAKTGVQSDVNGFFSLTLPSGTYTLMTVALGYDSSIMVVNLLPGSVTNKKIVLERKEMELKSVEVSVRKTDKVTHINTGVTTITPRELKLMPSAGGEPDLAQYLQVLPGVVFTGDQGGQLYIRGGSPAQSGIYLDGITIYNPFHSIGLFSVFETEAIRSVDVHSAGFGAQYGNRTSAIVDVHTRDGNKNHLAGLVSASPLMARALLEGPLVKSKKEGVGITFLVTGKTSFINSTSKALYGGLGEQFRKGLPYEFTDLYGKISLNADNGSKLNVFGFNFDDKSTLRDAETFNDIAKFRWTARGAGATFVVSPGSSAALIDGKFAYSNYDIGLDKVDDPLDSFPRSSKIGGFEAAINFTYFLPKYSQLKYGMEVSGLSTSLRYVNTARASTTLDRQSTMAALYVLYRQNFSSKFIFEPGIRVQYYSELQKMSFQPRLGMKYNVSENVRLKAAGGVYAQNIISTKSDRDIVNLFTGFMLSPDQDINDPDGNPVKSNLQTAYHGVAGVEVDIDRVELNFEPWIKYFAQVDELNRNKILPADPDFLAATGIAKGVDLSCKYSYQRFYLWVAAGLQKVDYTSIDAKGKKQTYPTPFDARFNGNVVSSYALGEKRDWDISARFSIHSPFPFTQTQGMYESSNPTGAGLSTNPLTANGPLIGVLYADQINGGRLSWFHRLDVSARKRIELNKRMNLDITAAITNVYNRNNVFYIDRVTNRTVYQLPFFPSLNVTWNF